MSTDRAFLTCVCGASALLGFGFGLVTQNAMGAKQALIRAVAERSVEVGWPHLATPAEARAVTLRVRRTYIRVGAWYGAVRCWTPTGLAGRWVCGVHRADARPVDITAPTRPKQVVQAFRVVVHVSPDGAYRIVGRRP